LFDYKNEKFVGDALLQKTYTAHPISKRQRRNQGELPQYLVKNCHPAIISRETFALVQRELARRGAERDSERPPELLREGTSYSGKYALSGIMVCGMCGAPFRRSTWRSADEQDWDWNSEQFRSLMEKRRKFPQDDDSEQFRLPPRLETYDGTTAHHVLEKVTALDAEHLLISSINLKNRMRFFKRAPPVVRFAHSNCL